MPSHHQVHREHHVHHRHGRSRMKVDEREENPATKDGKPKDPPKDSKPEPRENLKDVPGEKPVKVPPRPGPWSDWFPGDNGRWLWQARSVPGGGWEYQFMEGMLASKGQTPHLYDMSPSIPNGVSSAALMLTAINSVTMPAAMPQAVPAAVDDGHRGKVAPEVKTVKSEESIQKATTPEAVRDKDKIPTKKEKSKGRSHSKRSQPLDKRKDGKIAGSKAEKKVHGWLKEVPATEIDSAGSTESQSS